MGEPFVTRLQNTKVGQRLHLLESIKRPIDGDAFRFPYRRLDLPLQPAVNIVRLAKRLALECFNSLEMVYTLQTIEGAIYIERIAHKLLADRHAFDEWFFVSADRIHPTERERDPCRRTRNFGL